MLKMDDVTIIAMALVAPVIVVSCGLFLDDDKKPLTVEPVKKKTTVNVLCIEGYEYIQNTVSGIGAYGTIYTQRFINTDNGLQAKICRDAEEKTDADIQAKDKTVQDFR